ncbi:metalloproteinase inhibitor 1-like [Lytechinus pictus]|uniref:metalloproteinase inhibitor 1-like n=1 Tax=Lytechinus pictus TaxID=7653 RepID=UPI0030BA13D6
MQLDNSPFDSLAEHNFTEYEHYQGRVKRVLKDESSFANVGDLISFYSPVSACVFPPLELDRPYAIGGKLIDGRLIVGSCDGIAIRFDELTLDQKKGFKRRYKKQCDSCPIEGASEQEEGCIYNPEASQRFGGQDCEYLYSFCKLRKRTGDCRWKRTAHYDTCFAEREALQNDSQP